MVVNDVTEAFGDWVETLEVERKTGGFVNARWVFSAPVTLYFSGVVQNATPKDLEVMPGADSSVEVLKIHTTFRLEATDKQTKNAGDIVTYGGDRWRVINIAYRVIGNYNKALLVRLE